MFLFINYEDLRKSTIPSTVILEYYAKRSTDSTIAYYFRILYGFAVTPNTIWNARKAIAAMFGDMYKEILNKISEGVFVQFDESPIKISGKKGYVWVVTTTDVTYLVVSPSRGAAVLDMHFAPLLNMPVVVDGYNAYNMFNIRQRCWIHLLRDAEKYAINNRGNDLHCYLRLRTLYKRIKDKESASCAECLDLQNSLLRIADAYGSSHKLCKKLENAAPHMFTFLRYPGMPPHNNAAELEIRDAVVLQRNVRHQLSEPGGMHVFSVLISIARTCHKQGIFPRIAVENMVMNSNWSPFEPPDQCQKKIPVPAVTA